MDRVGARRGDEYETGTARTPPIGCTGAKARTPDRVATSSPTQPASVVVPVGAGVWRTTARWPGSQVTFSAERADSPSITEAGVRFESATSCTGPGASAPAQAASVRAVGPFQPRMATPVIRAP